MFILDRSGSSRGDVFYNFEVFWYLMGKKSGILELPPPPRLSLFSQLFKQLPPESPKNSESNKLHAPGPLIALNQLRVKSGVKVLGVGLFLI